MTALILVVAAQLADMTAYALAIVRYPQGESNPLQQGSPTDVVIAKAAGIVVMVALLGLGRVRLGRLYRPALLLVIVPALIGAWSALVNGGLVG